MQYALLMNELMAKPRVTATLPEDVFEYLSEWAEREQRPLSNLVAYVLTTAVRDIQKRQQEQHPYGLPSSLPDTKPSPINKGKGS